MKKQFTLLLTFCCIFFATSNSLAQKNQPLVDTLSVYSSSMDVSIKNVVILPDGYTKAQKSYPVVYLLHGYGGTYSTWIKGIKPTLQEEATKLDLIIVCPDGKNSWYWDSPINEKVQFETYVTKELVSYIDSNFRTIANNKGRAITGLSMGGHGGLWLGINHPDVFGACGSMSGGVDIRPFPNNWNMKNQLGNYNENKEIWNKHTVINQLHKIKPNSIEIIIDCGVNDFFYEVNENLHKQLLYLNIPHDYITRPGAHTGEYWQSAVDYQLLFFWKFFNKQK